MSGSRERVLTRVFRAKMVAVWAAALLAIGHLPAELVAWPWLVALTVPAIGLLVLLRTTGLRGWQVRGIAACLQVGGVLFALEIAGPLGKAPAFACTLLPPLAYLAARGTAGDTPLALIFGLCTVAGGTVLRGHAASPFVEGFVLAGTLALLLDTRSSALRARTHEVVGSQRALPGSGPTLAVVLATGLAGLGALELLRVIPTPHGLAARTSSSSRAAELRRTGLSRSFALDGGRGTPLLLQSSELIRVRALDGRPVPGDLYLRCAFFDIAGLDGWRASALRTTTLDTRRSRWQTRQPRPELPVRHFAIEPLDDLTGRVFVVPGMTSIEGLARVSGQPDLGFFRQPVNAARSAYRIDCQLNDPRAATATQAARWRRLTRLPASLRTPEFTALARELLPRLHGGPYAKALAIRAALAGRCRYALRTPDGGSKHALVNFLWGNREGYCMHFASALAILLRHAGVACRIGAGVFRGKPAPDPSPARIYGSSHAHAWVELPLRGLGWVVVEATPPAAIGGGPTVPDAFRGEDAAGNAMPDTELAPTTAGPDLLDLLRRSPLGRWWVWAALALVWILASVGPGRRRPAPPAPGLPATARPVRRLLDRILGELARAGFARRQGATLESYLADLERCAGVDCVALAAAFVAYQEVRFGQRTFDARRRAQLMAGIEASRACSRRAD